MPAWVRSRSWTRDPTAIGYDFGRSRPRRTTGPSGRASIASGGTHALFNAPRTGGGGVRVPCRGRSPARHRWRHRVWLPCRTERHARCRYECIRCGRRSRGNPRSVGRTRNLFRLSPRRSRRSKPAATCSSRTVAAASTSSSTRSLSRKPPPAGLRQIDLLGKRVPILSAEDLVVLKLLFNRHKDIVGHRAADGSLDPKPGSRLHSPLVGRVRRRRRLPGCHLGFAR